MTITRTRPVARVATPARAARSRPWPALLVVAALVTLHLLVLTQAPAAPRTAVGLPLVSLLPGALLLKALAVRRRGAELLLCALSGSLAVLLTTATVLALAGRLTPLDCLIGLDVSLAVLAVAAAVRRRHAARAGGGGRGSGAPAAAREPGAAAPIGPGVAAGSTPIGPGVAPGSTPDGSGVGGAATRSRVAPAGHGPVAAVAGWLAGSAGRGPAVPVSALVTLGAGGAGVALAVAGAARLNTGGGPELTLAAFGAVLVAVGGAARAAGRRAVGVAAVALYLAGLAVLLATSLRGTGVTGHDIKIEYHVLVEVLESGRWRPGGEYPGYNSCLSLTTLPAFLARLLGLAPLDVYRVAYQLIFACAPVGVFVLARRLLPALPAVLAGALFVAFPTFINDMPMLNRQEIALLFFLVLLLGLVDVRGARGPRIALILIAAAGLTVSHYSSTAVAAVLLGIAAGLRLLRRRVPALRDRVRRPPGLAWVALALAGMLAGWAVCTGSASAFAGDLSETGRAIGARAAVLSDSSRYLRLGGGAADDGAVLRGYVDGLRAERELAADACPVTVLPADELPPTRAGTAIRAPHTVNTLLRQAVVLLFMAGAAAGCALLWWRAARRGRPATRVLAETGTAALVLLGVAVVAPQITDSYGLLRLYQQMLPLFGPAVVLCLVGALHVASAGAGRGVAGRVGTGHSGAGGVGAGRVGGHRAPAGGVSGRGRAGLVLAVLVVGVLATTSGLAARLTGGYPPQLNLADAGPYYRAWYGTEADAAQSAAVERALPAGAPLLTDGRIAAVLRAHTDLRPVEGVAPGTVWPDSYLVVRVVGGLVEATQVVGERVVRYTFAPGCLTGGRELLAAVGELRVYGPDRRAR